MRLSQARTIALLIGNLVSGNRAAFEHPGLGLGTGSPPRGRRHGGGPAAAWPWDRAGALRLLHGFSASTVGQADDEGLPPVRILPETLIAAPGFRSSFLLSMWSADQPLL